MSAYSSQKTGQKLAPRRTRLASPKEQQQEQQQRYVAASMKATVVPHARAACYLCSGVFSHLHATLSLS